MAQITARMRFKQDTKANFESVNIVLKAGEPSFETDTKRIKVGDGTTPYNQLPYRAITTDETVELIEDNTTYTNSVPIVQAIGGIAAGTTFNNMPFEQVFNKLLYPYVKPTVSLKIGLNDGALTTSGSTREIGNGLTKVKFNSVLTRKSDNLKTLNLYSGSTIAGTPSISASGGTVDYTYTPSEAINTTTIFKAVLNDGTSDVTSNQITITFVRPMYIGYVDGNLTTSTINQTHIKGSTMTKEVVTKSNRSKSVTATNCKFCFAYPASYGDLKSVLDPNNFEILGSFDKTTMQIACLDNTNVNYNVYLFKNIYSPNSFAIQYKF